MCLLLKDPLASFTLVMFCLGFTWDLKQDFKLSVYITGYCRFVFMAILLRREPQGTTCHHKGFLEEVTRKLSNALCSYLPARFTLVAIKGLLNPNQITAKIAASLHRRFEI